MSSAIVLSNQHVINAIAKVSEAFTRQRQKQHKFKRTAALRFDARTLTFKRDFHQASLTVCPKGRLSGELQLPTARPVKLRTWKTGSADLTLQNGEFYLHIAVSREAPQVPEPTGSLGVDLGVKRVAVTFDNTFQTAKFVRHKKRQFQHTRASLQSNGSRPARRVLRRVSGRENRFVTDSNHCISKKIVAKASKYKALAAGLESAFVNPAYTS